MGDKEIISARISKLENLLERLGYDVGDTAWINLAHARKEWSQGCYSQAIRDLDKVEREAITFTGKGPR